MDQCLSFINCQLKPRDKPGPGEPAAAARRAVTISRASGSGGHVVARRLAELLQAQTPRDACPWTVFDRQLVDKAIEEQHLPKHWERFMPEDRISEISDIMDELFGLHPSSWTLVRKVSDTMLHLAELGNVILIGRAANIVTSKLDYVFHVRLVGPLAKRVAYIQELEHLSLKAAKEFVRKEDAARRRYVKKYFGKDIEDPLLYHLVINTDLVSYEEAARLIAEAVVGRQAAGKESK
jgi:cytidylate kinase